MAVLWDGNGLVAERIETVRKPISSCTSAAAVMKRTFKPFWQAAKPKPRAIWVLPVPEGPRAMMFSRRSI